MTFLSSLEILVFRGMDDSSFISGLGGWHWVVKTHIYTHTQIHTYTHISTYPMKSTSSQWLLTVLTNISPSHYHIYPHCEGSRGPHNLLLWEKKTNIGFPPMCWWLLCSTSWTKGRGANERGSLILHPISTPKMTFFKERILWMCPCYLETWGMQVAEATHTQSSSVHPARMLGWLEKCTHRNQTNHRDMGPFQIISLRRDCMVNHCPSFPSWAPDAGLKGIQ